MPIVIKKSVSTGWRVTFKNMIIGQAMLLTQGSWDEVRDRLIAYIELAWTDEIATNKEV